MHRCFGGRSAFDRARNSRAHSSAGERSLHTGEVQGSIPCAPTRSSSAFEPPSNDRIPTSVACGRMFDEAVAVGVMSYSFVAFAVAAVQPAPCSRDESTTLRRPKRTFGGRKTSICGINLGYRRHPAFASAFEFDCAGDVSRHRRRRRLSSEAGWAAGTPGANLSAGGWR